MRNRLFVLSFLFLLAAGSWLLLSESHQSNSTALISSTANSDSSRRSALPNLDKGRRPAQLPGSVGEKPSVQTMINVMSQYTRQESNLKDLVDHLQNTGQGPKVVRSTGSEVGDMHIVRTEKPPAGSRYFHAQYFTNEEGKPRIQHMSVEFKAGTRTMQDVVSSVQTSFSVSSPALERKGYRLWNLANGYILWVKELELEDMQHDPFNAYTAADIGTVRVAVEEEIH